MKYSTRSNLENTSSNTDDFLSCSKTNTQLHNVKEELNNIDKKNTNNLPDDLLNKIEYISPIPRKKQKRKMSDVIFIEEKNEPDEEFKEGNEDDFSSSDENENSYKSKPLNKKDNIEFLYKKNSNKSVANYHFNNLSKKDSSINNVNNSLLNSYDTFRKDIVFKLKNSLLNNKENDNNNFKVNKSMNSNDDNNGSVNRNLYLNNNSTKNNITQNNESQISDSLNFNLSPNIFFDTLSNKTNLKKNDEGSEYSNSVMDSSSINNINQNLYLLKDILNSIDDSKSIISNSSNETKFNKILLNANCTPFIPKSIKNTSISKSINKNLNDEEEKVNYCNINQKYDYKNTSIINNNNNDTKFELNPEDYLIEMFGRKGWICRKCDNFNFETRNKCNRCFYAKEPKTIEEINKIKKEREEKSNKVKNIGKRSDWLCLNCQNLNYGFRKFCNRCHIERQEDFPTIRINSYSLK